jgi:hypothetical protein
MSGWDVGGRSYRKERNTMERAEVERHLQALRMEIAHLIRNGEDEEGLRLRALLAELERWEAIRLNGGAAPRGIRSPLSEQTP